MLQDTFEWPTPPAAAATAAAAVVHVRRTAVSWRRRRLWLHAQVLTYMWNELICNSYWIWTAFPLKVAWVKFIYVKVSKSRKKKNCPRFSKKTNARAYLCTEKCLSVRFFEKSRISYIFFEIYWPLKGLFFMASHLTKGCYKTEIII